MYSPLAREVMEQQHKARKRFEKHMLKLRGNGTVAPSGKRLQLHQEKEPTEEKPAPSIQTSMYGQKYVYSACHGERVPGSKLLLDRDGFVDVTFEYSGYGDEEEELVTEDEEENYNAAPESSPTPTQTHSEEPKPGPSQSTAASVDAMSMTAAVRLPPKKRGMALDRLVGKRRRTASTDEA